MSENRVIGQGGGLPWHLPDELKHFKRVTSGGLVLMGRRTFESFDGLLPNRRHIVLTRDAEWSHEQVEIAADLDEALALAWRHGDEQLLVLGGATIYEQTIGRADRMVLTTVHAHVEGDTFFPEFDPDEWRVADERHHPADALHAYSFTIRTYDRR